MCIYCEYKPEELKLKDQRLFEFLSDKEVEKLGYKK